MAVPLLSLSEKVRRVVAQLKQAEARRARLEQRCRFEGGSGGGGGGGEDASLLHHWVEELDEFEEGEMAFMDKMRWVDSHIFLSFCQVPDSVEGSSFILGRSRAA